MSGKRVYRAKKRSAATLIVLSVAAVAALLLVAGAGAGVSSGQLAAPTGVSPTGEKYNNTHWKVAAGDTITDTIINATDAIEGSGGCDATLHEVAVIIQSSAFGNVTLCGTLSGSTITFSWDVPESGVCSTTTVSYNDTGNHANNSLITPGGNSVAGLAIVDGNGNLITDCGPGKVAPEIVTEPSGGVFGSKLNDTATLSGGATPTGTITFDLYPPSSPDCAAGTSVYTDVVTITDNGTFDTLTLGDNPGGYTSSALGTYNWVASYSGDGNNLPVASDCGDEAYVVTAAASDVETIVEDGTDAAVTNGSHVPLGSAIHDKATVTAPDSPFQPPAGTIDFSFFSSIDCGVANSDSPANQLGVSLVSGVAESTPTAPLGAGSYSYLDHYNSDDTNKWTDGDSICNETFIVDKGPTTTVTVVKNAAGATVTTVPIGSAVHDHATVGPAVTGIPITGTVTYTFSTNGCTGPFNAFDTEPVGTDSKATGALSFGNYAFQASYGGDSNYAASTGDCEPFSVFNPPLTPGYWKNHQTQTTALLAGCIKLGNSACITWGVASTIWNGMNCSNTSGQNAIGCLAGHLLATKLNLANGSNPCIATAVSRADSFLKAGTVDGVTGINYTGPGSYSISAAQRAEAIKLKNPLDAYNNGLGC